MTLPELLCDAHRDCARLTPAERFDRWLRTWRPAAMALMRKDGPFQGSHLNAWLKIADRLLDAFGIEPEEPEDKKRVRTAEEKKAAQRKRDAAWEAVERIHERAESDK